MNKEDPEKYRLREQTYKIIQRLKNEQKTSEAEACRIFYNMIRQKHKDCGFVLMDFNKFYACYRQFKRKI